MDDKQRIPPDPITALAEGAAAVHETFLAYVAAGFTESQALYLIGQILTAGMRGQEPPS